MANSFEVTVKELISEKIGQDYSIDVKFDSTNKLEQIISNEGNLKSTSLTFFSPKTKSFKVLTIYKNGEKTELFGKFDAYYEVPTATRPVRFGTNISPGDIKKTKVRRLKTGEIPLKEMPQIFGMQAKFNIMPGQVIKKSDLKLPSVVKENDPVTLLYSSNNITLKTMGVALATGAIGDKIRVKNEKTGIVVFGEIIDKNVVKVNSDK